MKNTIKVTVKAKPCVIVRVGNKDNTPAIKQDFEPDYLAIYNKAKGTTNEQKTN